MSKRRVRKKTQTATRTPSSADRSKLALYATVGVVVVGVILGVVGLGVLSASGGGGSDGESGGKSAVIVDQLQLTQPDPQFVSDAREALGLAGYSVEYIAGDHVTVDTYRRLASHGYDLVILRAHAGITTEVDAETGQKTEEEYVSLFTNEAYDPSKYSEDQSNRLGKATYPGVDAALFGIGPEFIKSMPGDFDDATVILMGCDGLRSQVTGQAFLDQGAGAFASWSQQVSAPHTDQATYVLLKHLLFDGLPLQQAVEQTANEVGPDPTYDGELRILES